MAVEEREEDYLGEQKLEWKEGEGFSWWWWVLLVCREEEDRLSVSEWPVIREEESTFQLVQAVRRANVVKKTYS